MNREILEQLRRSQYIHRPMEADFGKSMDAHALEKKVLDTVAVWDGADLGPWTFTGEGEASVSGGELRMKTWSRADHWPAEEVRSVNVAKGDYATFGSYIAHIDVHGFDTARCNRIRFKIRPECDGLHSPIIRAGFTNEGKIRIPDAYSREGFNAINLVNHEWNEICWEIDAIAHDSIGELSFNVHRYGKEVSSGEELVFFLKDICLEQVEDVNVVHGWQCHREEAVYASAGYLLSGEKIAIANTQEKSFRIENAETGETVFMGQVRTVENVHGTFSVLDFSPLRAAGTYRICFGTYRSGAFEVAADVLEGTVWKLLNFLFSERCGCPVPGKHGTCHGDVIIRHGGLIKNYQGGWHDAADVSQQTVQSAEVTDALLCVMEAAGEETLRGRLSEEVQWGLDFVLRSRLGGGYRATGAAIRRWNDGWIGDMDDCEARVHNGSFENFIMSGVEAHASRCLKTEDRELAWKCGDAAKEDFAFAEERFAEVGVEVPFMREHTSNASRSQYYAAAAWAAAQLFETTGEESYAEAAARYADLLLTCQETGEAGLPFDGFFYRDEEKKTIVHFSHQSREHIFVMALEAVCRALPGHEHLSQWEAGMRRYGNYLKALMAYTAPYGMLPAGVYHEREADEKDVFERLHPTVKFEQERENYLEQLRNGIALGKGYYIKCFAVWFSYRGNSAIHLSMGKAASLAGAYFDDEELLQIAREQLYWVVGKNPFGQSLIYGAGERYGQQYTALLGETVGEIPVGVQTRGNEDLPYWPQANIATYREVWTTPAGRYLWIAADLMKKG